MKYKAWKENLKIRGDIIYHLANPSKPIGKSLELMRLHQGPYIQDQHIKINRILICQK